jgi:4-hydroxy-2-oxoheptanedioate aldolase
MCLVYSSLGLPPLVRIPSPDPYEACKVLDGGAAGVLAPYIETPQQVQSLVGATRLRPLKGQRLEEALSDRHCLGSELNDYLDRRCAGNFLMINIESVPACESGMKSRRAGRTASPSAPRSFHKSRCQSNTRILRMRRSGNRLQGEGKGLGRIHFPEHPHLQIKWAQQGLNIVLHSSDARLFQQGLERDIAAIRRAIGDR